MLLNLAFKDLYSLVLKYLLKFLSKYSYIEMLYSKQYLACYCLMSCIFLILFYMIFTLHRFHLSSFYTFIIHNFHFKFCQTLPSSPSSNYPCLSVLMYIYLPCFYTLVLLIILCSLPIKLQFCAGRVYAFCLFLCLYIISYIISYHIIYHITQWGQNTYLWV